MFDRMRKFSTKPLLGAVLGAAVLAAGAASADTPTGNKANERLDRKGERIEKRLDDKGDRKDEKLDKKGYRIDKRRGGLDD